MVTSRAGRMYETLEGTVMGSPLRRASERGHKALACAATGFGLLGSSTATRCSGKACQLAMSYGRKAKVEAGEAVPLRCKLPRLPDKEGMQMNRARAEEYRSLHEASYEAA